MEKKKFILAGIMVVILLVIFRKPAIEVETATVSRGDIYQTVSSSGKIDAEQKADLTFQGAGRLAWVGVKAGDKVQKYQGLASLDKTVLNATYQQAVNTYKAYEAAAQKAEDDVKGHDSDETFAQKSTRMAAQVARDNAFDAMKAAETNLKFATIIAPFAGLVTKAEPAYPGSNVTATSAVYSIVNPETFYFSTEVNETDVAKIKVGQKAVLNLDAFPDNRMESVVSDIGLVNIITSTGGTAYQVKIALPKKEGVDFRLGFNGDAEIIVGEEKDILYVPAEALVEEGGESYIWRVEKGKKVKKIKVEIGDFSIDRSEVKEGLAEGDVVIIRPSLKLKAGGKVKY